MTHRDRYIDLIRRHLGRDPKRSDGVVESVLTKCERRLGFRLPAAVRDYYLIAGRIDQLNKVHNLLFTPSELHVEDKHLWFMEENQAVVHWGLPVKQISAIDPFVYQRANVEGAKWYSEKMRFSAFLVRIYDWQAGIADAPT